MRLRCWFYAFCFSCLHCGGPDFVTRHGIEVYANGHTNKQQTECATEIYLSSGTLLPQTEAHFFTELIDGYQTGLQQGSTVYVVWLVGFGSNAFFHELWHTQRGAGNHPPGINWPEVTELKRRYRESNCIE